MGPPHFVVSAGIGNEANSFRKRLDAKELNGSEPSVSEIRENWVSTVWMSDRISDNRWGLLALSKHVIFKSRNSIPESP